MMRAIVSTSVRFKLLMIGLAGVLLLLGATQLQNARVDVLPEFAPTTVEVQTEALGLSAEEVEELVTVPLEADLLHGVAFLEKIESQSLPGLSSIVMTFEPGTEVLKARQVVAERLTQAHALPNVAKAPVMLQPLSSLNRFMIVGLSSAEKSLIEMSVLARWTVQPRLMGVPGVANVAIFGQRERQLQVLVDPARLRQRDLTLDQVVETAGNALWFSPLTFLEASTPGTGGFIDTPQQRLGHPAHPAHPIRRGPRAGRHRPGAGRSSAQPRRRGDGGRGPSAAHRRRPRRRWDRPAARHREVPERQYARRDPQCRCRPGGDAAGPAGHHRRHHAVPRGLVHRRLDRQRLAGDPDRLPADRRRARA